MMDIRSAYALCAICILCANGGFGDELEKYLNFPPNFILGTATSAVQVEGAWNVSGKGESVWDRFIHENRSRIQDHTTADDACDSYYKTKSDVALLKKMGFNVYRFSISWSRVLPTGFVNNVNPDGIRYYHELIDELLANDIEPLVTIYHWDHPQVLEDAGGWLNCDIVEWYSDYARFVFKEFGSKVKKFITINEPCLYCLSAYELGIHAPGKAGLRGVAPYLCVHHMLKAHATTYRIYEKEFKSTQKGLVGANIQIETFYPKYSNGSAAVHRGFQFMPGWYLHPIYSKEGDYPEIMKQMIAKKSKEQGFPKSRLPELTPEEIAYIRGSYDFLAVNYYTSALVEDHLGGSEPSFYNDWDIQTSVDPSWENTSAPWLKVFPRGFGDGLRELANTYGDPPIIVTENGVATGHEIEDTARIQYLYKHIREMLIALNRDGVKILGYIVWSFLDDFEFGYGYRTPFGIVQVNHNDPQKLRTPKASAAYITRVTKAASNNGKLPKS